MIKTTKQKSKTTPTSEDDGGTPFPTEYSQEEINHFETYYAGQKISEGDPVKICYIREQPFVITGAISGGRLKGWQRVIAWPVLTLENCGDREVKTYEQAHEEYSARLRDDSSEYQPLDYQNMKINCGSAKKPAWWVMVGPEMAFTVAPAVKRAKSKPKASAIEIIEQTDVTVAEEELVPADLNHLHQDALARWRRDPGTRDDDAASNGYHPQMLRMIPIDQIEPSPTNPRKYFDQAKLQEMADSIIEHGLIEPILVRPLRWTTTGALIGGDIGETLEAWPGLASNLYYQLVAGERRWRAVKLAGLTKIEAKVRDLDDKAVLEIQFIENLQRTDLSPIEEAEGYNRLLNEHGYTAESLAGKLGKSKSYVYARLKICNLPEQAMEALAKGELPATIGELIGRLPSMEMREKFWEDNYSDIGSDWFDPPSFRNVKDDIERGYMRELKSAPFSQADKKLLLEAGSCKDCPFRTGNNKVEYPDSRADICTKPPCYDQKVQAHLERQVEKAKASGASVLTKKETAKLFDNAGSRVWLTFEAKQKYIEMEEQPVGDKEKRSYKQLLEGHVEPVVAVDPLGKAHILAPKAEAEKVLKELHGIKPESTANRDSVNNYEKKRQQEKKLRQQAAAEIVAGVVGDANVNLFLDDEFLRVVAKFLIDKGDADIARAIAKRREIEYDANKVRGSVVGIVDGLDAHDVPGLIVEWLLQRELEWWAQYGAEHDKFVLCEYFDSNPKAMLKAVATRVKQMEKDKAKKKAKAVAEA